MSIMLEPIQCAEESMPRLLKIGVASKLIRMFSPDFVEVDELILLPSEVSYYQKNLKGFSDKTSFEAFQNHTHMIDLFRHDANREVANSTYLDRSHPDFQELCFAGKFMAKMWFEKLKEQFPHYRFRVYYTEKDDPIIRFHRVRSGEPFWLDESRMPEEVSSGKIIVYDTGKA